jgi:uncharacterized phage protein (predicted DNA packaging)
MNITQSLLTKVKKSIRISHTALDEDILDGIRAALSDLRMCGISEAKLDPTGEVDPLILNAVKMYCKKEYTDDPAKAARYQEGYDALKSSLMMADGYRAEVVADE